MTTGKEVTTKPAGLASAIENVLIGGDLSKLTPEQRVSYYNQVCESLGLNQFTKPFEYISLNGKLTLYARRDATDQLRKRDHISINIVSRERIEDLYIVTARASAPDGREDESVGAVTITALKGDHLANAMMKAETKAKRRATLSICGLGWTDETEVDSIPGARIVDVADNGEVIDAPPAEAQPSAKSSNGSRPYDPETLKLKIKAAAGLYDDFNPTEKQLKLLRYGLELLFVGYEPAVVERNRHHLLNYLIGKSSTKDVTGREFKAIVDKWLEMRPKDDGSGDYEVSPVAIQEAWAVVSELQADEYIEAENQNAEEP